MVIFSHRTENPPPEVSVEDAAGRLGPGVWRSDTHLMAELADRRVATAVSVERAESPSEGVFVCDVMFFFFCGTFTFGIMVAFYALFFSPVLGCPHLKMDCTILCTEEIGFRGGGFI
jgi:hypothetical protein